MTEAELEDLKPGDRVVYSHYAGDLHHGTVVRVGRSGGQFSVASVCFDEIVIGFHSCMGTVEMGRGQYLYPKDIDIWSLENKTRKLQMQLKTLWDGALT